MSVRIHNGRSPAQVPNIRFSVGKMLERLVPLLESAVVEASVRPVTALALLLPGPSGAFAHLLPPAKFVFVWSLETDIQHTETR